MSKTDAIALIVAFGTMILLYLIGYFANIEFLKFEISSTYTEISLVPIAVGFIVAFISDRIIKSKVQ